MISGITETAVNGQELGVGGYLDIGLIDTMQDLIVNFIGALIFSVFGFFYVKSRGKSRVVGRFIPRRKAADRDFLRMAKENELPLDEKVKKGSAASAAVHDAEDASPDQMEEKSTENA